MNTTEYSHRVKKDIGVARPTGLIIFARRLYGMSTQRFPSLVGVSCQMRIQPASLLTSHHHHSGPSLACVARGSLMCVLYQNGRYRRYRPMPSTRSKSTRESKVPYCLLCSRLWQRSKKDITPIIAVRSASRITSHRKKEVGSSMSCKKRGYILQ